MDSNTIASRQVEVSRYLERYLNVARANFLALPVALVAVGVAAAAQDGHIAPVRTGLIFAGVISFHIAVNAFNEYSDYKRGIDEETDQTAFSGGSGTLPKGELEPKSALQMGLLSFGIGTIIFLYLLSVVGIVLVPIVAGGAVAVVGYTDFLARVGLGEAAAGLGLGSLPVIGTAIVQDGTIGVVAYAASVPAFFLTFNLLLLNEFPDEGPDRWGGRKNLVHLFERTNAARLYVFAGLAPPVAIVAFVATEIFPPLALVGVVPSVFLYRPVNWAINNPDVDPSVATLRDNVIWVLFTNFLLAAGLALSVEMFIATTEMSINDGVFLLGRTLFGIVIVFMAFNNFADLTNVARQIGEAGVPYPKAATIFASTPLLFSGLSIGLGVYPALGSAYLVIFLAVTTLLVHNFLGIEDADEQENQIFHFLKNLLILAAALVFFSLALGSTEWSYGIGVTLFS